MRILFINKAPRKYVPYDLEKVQKLLNSYASPGTKIEVDFPDDFPGAQVTGALHAQLAGNCFDHYLDTPAIIRKVVWAQDNGYDAVIQSNTFDPGVDGSRYVAKIPVLGPFRTTLHIVATMADRIGIMVPLASHVPYAWKLLRLAGMENHITDVQAIHMYGDDLADRKPELLEGSVKVIKALKQGGAQAVMPMGGLLIPYVVSPEELEQRCGIQVYNMKAITIRVAEMCVALGLKQSPLTYPQAKLTHADFV
jgi:Asp/Glu/hydantoin racemase